MVTMALAANAQETVEKDLVQTPPSPEVSESPSPVEAPAVQEVYVPEPPQWRKHTKFVVGVFYASPGVAKFKNSAFTVPSHIPVEAEFEVDSTAGLQLELRKSPPHHWGLHLGLQIESNRDVKSGKLTSRTSTTNVTYSSPRPKLRSEILYGSLVYRWDQLYIPFGLNISAPHLDTKSLNSNGEMSLTGRIGAQLGIGFQFTELFGMELQSRATGLEMWESSYDPIYFLDYGVGFLSDIRLFGKFAF